MKLSVAYQAMMINWHKLPGEVEVIKDTEDQEDEEIKTSSDNIDLPTEFIHNASNFYQVRRSVNTSRVMYFVGQPDRKIKILCVS